MELKKHHTGLTSEQVFASRKAHGANVLTPPKRAPLWKLFLEKFEDPIIRILLIAACLSLGISIIHGASRSVWPVVPTRFVWPLSRGGHHTFE